MNKAITLLVFLPLAYVSCLAQEKARPFFCRQSVFTALSPLPELTYRCPENLTDSDEKILNLPERISAIKRVAQGLASFTSANWWQANITELDACKIHGRAGELANEEKNKLKDGDYLLRVFGDHQFRLVMTPDPCYQTGFNGSNAFLLYYKEGNVFVTQIFDGYYSRIDNSVGIDSVNLNGQAFIEISTANNMPLEFTNYYFAIDPKNNQAIPKKIFKVGGRLTNKISSAIVLSEQRGIDAAQLTVIRRNHLLPVFGVYLDDDAGKIDDSGRKLRRVIYRWNGRFYYRAK